MIAWAVFVCLIVTAGITALQAVRIGRFGGYVLVTGTVAAAIAVSSDAIKAGGTELLAALLIASALFQFVFASRIAMFRRILTPSVSGTILILMAVSVVPIASDRITDLPPGHQPVEGFICTIVTLGIIVLIVLKGGRRLRPWAAIFGLGGGAAVASVYGLYNVELVKDAAWIGVPIAADMVLVPDFGPSFWALLPAFLLVSMACAIRAMGAALAIQDVSWRVPRAADFRTVQGAVTRDSLANLIAGIGGGIFMSTRSQTIAFIQITHVSARWVGLSFGAVFAAIAFVPKVIALILALPGAVFSGYVFVMIAALFVAGIKMVVSNGLDHRQGLIVGLSFCAAVGCEYGLIAPELILEIAGGCLRERPYCGGDDGHPADDDARTDGRTTAQARDRTRRFVTENDPGVRHSSGKRAGMDDEDSSNPGGHRGGDASDTGRGGGKRAAATPADKRPKGGERGSARVHREAEREQYRGSHRDAERRAIRTRDGARHLASAVTTPCVGGPSPTVSRDGLHYREGEQREGRLRAQPAVKPAAAP